jgi:hypothetical protein
MGVRVPMTLEEYCVVVKPKPAAALDASDMADFYQDDYMDDDDDDDAMDDDGEDSGHGDL